MDLKKKKNPKNQKRRNVGKELHQREMSGQTYVTGKKILWEREEIYDRVKLLRKMEFQGTYLYKMTFSLRSNTVAFDRGKK